MEVLLPQTFLKIEWEYIMGTKYRAGHYRESGCPDFNCPGHFKKADGTEYPSYPPRVDLNLSKFFAVGDTEMTITKLNSLSILYPEFECNQMRAPAALSFLALRFGEMLDKDGELTKSTRWGAHMGYCHADDQAPIRRIVLARITQHDNTKPRIVRYVVQYSHDGEYLDGFKICDKDYPVIDGDVAMYTPRPCTRFGQDSTPRTADEKQKEKMAVWTMLEMRKWKGPGAWAIRNRFPSRHIIETAFEGAFIKNVNQVAGSPDEPLADDLLTLLRLHKKSSVEKKKRSASTSLGPEDLKKAKLSNDRVDPNDDGDEEVDIKAICKG